MSAEHWVALMDDLKVASKVVQMVGLWVDGKAAYSVVQSVASMAAKKVELWDVTMVEKKVAKMVA